MITSKILFSCLVGLLLCLANLSYGQYSNNNVNTIDGPNNYWSIIQAGLNNPAGVLSTHTTPGYTFGSELGFYFRDWVIFKGFRFGIGANGEYNRSGGDDIYDMNLKLGPIAGYRINDLLTVQLKYFLGYGSYDFSNLLSSNLDYTSSPGTYYGLSGTSGYAMVRQDGFNIKFTPSAKFGISLSYNRFATNINSNVTYSYTDPTTTDIINNVINFNFKYASNQIVLSLDLLF